MHHFVNPTETYTREVNVMQTYVEDGARFLSVMRGIPYEKAKEFIQRKTQPGGEFAFKDPPALVLVRQENGDRKQVVTTFNDFLQSVYAERQMLSPSMTAYVHPDKKRSLLAIYIDKNLQLRKKAKAEMLAAKMAGDSIQESIGNSKQTTFKIKNNSLSGAHSSPYTILWNKSAHSTLTSTCRVATSYGNANNEKFLYGNRHYWCPDVARNNIISIINHSDLDRIQATMERYSLCHPTDEDIFKLLERCTKEYWRDNKEMDNLKELVRKLSPVEKSAFAFTSDLYHLAQINPEVVRTFLGKLSHHPETPLPVEEADKWIAKMDSNLEAFVFMICSNELNGGTMKDANGDKTNLKLRDARPDDYGRIGATTKNVIETLDEYEELIRTFWVTPNLPASIFHLPGIVRKSAVTSDTDSSIFTVAHWTTWYRGKLDFDKESKDIATTVVYLTSQLIRHILATTSAAMGVARQYVTKLEMKNEFYFPVLSLTSRAKHYYGYRGAQEGNVLKELELEVKGVALRNSNVPKEITAKAHNLIRFILDSAMRGEKIKIRQILRFIAKIEQEIRNGVFSGKFDLLPKISIKGKEAYKNPTSSNWLHYDMWESVFATTYGHAPPPPYTAVKIQVDLERKADLQKWLSEMDNPVIADKMRQWLQLNKKDKMAVFMLPEQVLSLSGIPKEIVKAVDVRPLIIQTVEAFYLILESLGIFMKNKDQTRLVSDEEWLLADDWPLPELDL